MSKLRKTRFLSPCWAIVVTAALVFAACGAPKEQPAAKEAKPAEQVAKPEPAAPPEEPAKPASKPGPPPGELGEIVPVTLDLLKLTPDEAMVSVALPSVDQLIERGIAFAKRVAPEGIDVDGIVADTIAGMAEDAGVTEAETFGDIATAKGFDLSGPAAFFLDLDPMRPIIDKAAAEVDAFNSAVKDLEKKAKVAKQAARTARTKAQIDGAGRKEKKAAEEAQAEAEAAAQAVEDKKVQQPEVAARANEMMAELGLPAIVGVVGCTDVALAEATVKEILASEGSPLAGTEAEDIEAEGVTIHCYDPNQFAYFFADNRLIGGTSLDLVKATAARLKNPAPVRYGTVDCPASAADEVVELIRMDRLMPFAAKLMPVVSMMDPSTSQLLDGQMSMVDKLVDAFTCADPAVATLTLNEDQIEFVTRIDMAAHEGLKAVTGAASPLRLAPLLPESTEAFLSIRFNDESKASIQQQGLGFLPTDMVPAQVSTMLPQFVQMIGDELTIGVMGVEDMLPKAAVLLALSDPESTRALLQILVPMEITETYNETDIMSVAAPLPVSLCLAYVGDVLMLATDVDTLKGMVDLKKSGEISPLFESLDPPLDPNVPRYGALVFKTEMVAELLPQAAALLGGLPPEASMVIDMLTKVVREIRASQGVVGNWQESNIAIYLNPPE